MTSDMPHSSGESDAASPSRIDHAQLRNALKAFKKRLKLTRLDDESKVGHGPMTGGSRSGVVAIPPPTRYPHEVWDELVRQGRLRRAGHGLYELPDER